MTKKKLLSMVLSLMFCFTAMITLTACAEKRPHIMVYGLSTQYLMGDGLDLTDAVVRYYQYEDEKDYTEIKLNREMVTGFDTSISGTKTMTISYKGLTCQLDYTVYNKSTALDYCKQSMQRGYDSELVSMVVSRSYRDDNLFVKMSQNVVYSERTDGSKSWVERTDNGYIQYFYSPTDTSMPYSYCISSDNFDEARKLNLYFGIVKDSLNVINVDNLTILEDGSMSIEYIINDSYGYQEKYIIILKNGFITKLIYIETDIDTGDSDTDEFVYSYTDISPIPARPTDVDWQEGIES